MSNQDQQNDNQDQQNNNQDRNLIEEGVKTIIGMGTANPVILDSARSSDESENKQKPEQSNNRNNQPE